MTEGWSSIRFLPPKHNLLEELFNWNIRRFLTRAYKNLQAKVCFLSFVKIRAMWAPSIECDVYRRGKKFGYVTTFLSSPGVRNFRMQSFRLYTHTHWWDQSRWDYKKFPVMICRKRSRDSYPSRRESIYSMNEICGAKKKVSMRFEYTRVKLLYPFVRQHQSTLFEPSIRTNFFFA